MPTVEHSGVYGMLESDNAKEDESPNIYKFHEADSTSSTARRSSHVCCHGAPRLITRKHAQHKNAASYVVLLLL
jgi:hypothetical protein